MLPRQILAITDVCFFLNLRVNNQCGHAKIAAMSLIITRARPLAAARVLKCPSLLSTVSQTGSLINRYICVHLSYDMTSEPFKFLARTCYFRRFVRPLESSRLTFTANVKPLTKLLVLQLYYSSF